MSTRAYRINKIESEETPSFNLSWHGNLMEYFHNRYAEGIMDIDIEELEEALKDKDVLDEIGEHVETLRKDIAWAKDNSDNIISYLTF